MTSEKTTGTIVVFKTDTQDVCIDVIFDGDTVWLSQEQMAQLFQKSKSTINEHISNIFEENELNKAESMKRFDASAFGKVAEYYYNLDVIISVGYRVKSIRGTEFRKWATKHLNEFIRKGFTMDDERLKNLGGGNYWKELLDRIRDIRSSEKVLYRQVLELYSTSIDYNPHCEETLQFFKIVQNKLHYAAHGQTAAEVIYTRADAEKPFMGLTSFTGEFPQLKDAKIAKNYLTESELKVLNNLVSGYFDFAEINAIEHKPMTMADHIAQLDRILSSGERGILTGPGTVTHAAAIEKATAEYRKFQDLTLSPLEEEYLKSILDANSAAKKGARKTP